MKKLLIGLLGAAALVAPIAATAGSANAADNRVTLPQIEIKYSQGTNGYFVIVPDTPHVQTRLYGVPGYPETEPITKATKVTSKMVGGTQFWIGYKLDDGYVAADPGTTHIDFGWAYANPPA